MISWELGVGRVGGKTVEKRNVKGASSSVVC